MNGSRRGLLAATGGVVASLAGCLGEFADAPSTGAPRTDAPEATDRRATTTDRRATTTASRDYPATVNATTAVEREEVEYVPENDTVRYVAAYGSEDPEGDDETPPEREPVYETVPFEEWAETECASVAADRANEVMSDRLDGETEGISAGVTQEDGEMAVFVAHQTTSDRDGDVISEPTVSYERVKQVAPERVDVTFEFSEQSHSCVVPVTTREMDVQQE